MQASIGRFRGGYCVYWTENGNRRRYQLKARTREEAEAEALDVYTEKTMRRGGVTVSDIWSLYIDHLGDKPNARTLGYTGKAILPHFGAYRPDQINDDLCRSYAQKRDIEGRKQGTIHTELGHLRSAMRFAAKKRLIDAAPDIERPAKPTPKERYLTEPEIAKLIDAASAPHIKLAILLLLGTAGRVGAILELTWDRVDMERGVINLRLESQTTRKGRAIVPIGKGLRAALQTARDAALSPYVVEYAGDQVKSIRKGFHNAVERAGLEGVNIHCMRHTAAVTMVSSGISMDRVAQFLGHSNPAITYQVYARYQPEHLQDAADILDFASFTKCASVQ